MAYVTDPETGRLVNDGVLVAPGTRTNILASIASIEERLTVLEDAAEDAEYAITTFAELQAAAALTTQVRVHLYDHITCTAAITLPANMTVIYRGKYLVDGGYSIIHYANVGDMTREKKFSGFVAGDIIGSFGNGTVYPEWWGLTDNAHDIAIQCAASASPVATNTRGIIVDLDARQYDVAAPINLSGKYAILRGKGSALTELQATTAWTATTWYETDIWTAGVSTANHAAMVWIGSAHTLGTVNSFRCGVQGLTLNTLYASQYNWTKRVSGISSQSYVEENSVIHDVEITYASGCGIGFPDHGPTYGNGGVINGLSISSVWIAGPCKRDSYGMYFTHWNANTSIDTFTIDMSLDQELSSAYAGAAPTQIHDWPMVGIMAGGNLSIKNGHIEGVGLGILVGENDGAGNTVTIENVEGYYLMNRGWGQIYRDQQIVTTLSAVATHNAGADINVTVGSSTGMAAGDVLLITSANGTNEATYEAYHTVVSVPDGTHVVIDTAWPGAGATATTAGDIQIIYKAPVIATNANYWDWGTVVLIAKDEESGGRSNVKDKVVLHNVNSKGVCKYVFRDAVYVQNISAYGSGGSPTGGARGVASYCRGNAYVNPTTWPFDSLSTTWTNETDRTYFIAPVY